MATIRDVARAAGVSTMTVSNVLNDRPVVRTETRERVLAAIADLDYRVNIAAKRLRSRRSGTIALAVPEVNLAYFGLLAEEVMRAAAVHGLRVVVEKTSATQDTELESLALSQRLMFDGLILSSSGIQDPDLLAVDYPLVMLGERSFQVPVPHVAMPNEAGAAAAVRHVLAGGSSRVVLLGGDPAVDGIASRRHAGYVTAHEAAAVAVDPALVRRADGYTMEAGYRAVGALLADDLVFDAIFCMTDSLAIGALRALGEHAVRVPEDVQVMGFDDVPEARFLTPSLSTVRPDHGYIAQTAVRLITSRIAGGPLERPGARFEAPFTIVPRGTTRPTGRAAPDRLR